jgi:putative ABC transport system permease protein
MAWANMSTLSPSTLVLVRPPIIGQIAVKGDYPFRMMWFTPLIGGAMVLLVSLVATGISLRPVLKLEPAIVFAGR